MLRRIVASALALFCVVGAAVALTSRVAAHETVIRPRVVIVAFFEVGNDTGDRPGELQYWVERDHLTRVIEVPGLAAQEHAFPAYLPALDAAYRVGHRIVAHWLAE
jgi:purine nucleoside permease